MTFIPQPPTLGDFIFVQMTQKEMVYAIRLAYKSQHRAVRGDRKPSHDSQSS
jgi:hypothetical protein